MSLRTTPLRPLKRKGFWYLNRRVPKAHRGLEARVVVQKSTGIRIADDPQGVAARVAIAQLDAQLLAHWRRQAAGESSDPKQRYDAAIETARDLDLAYVTVDRVAALPARELVDRVSRLGDPIRQDDRVIEAVYGTVPPPVLKLSQLREEYEAVVATSLRQKSERQLKRWRDVRDRAVEVFTTVLKNDKAIAGITREDVLAFRNHLQARILKGEIEIDTANKNLGRVATMVRTIDEAKQLRLQPVFDKIMIRGGRDRQRISYRAAFVQSHFLADGMFDAVNEEERRIIFLIIETGLRPAEACNLRRETIVLDHPVPHVRIRPDGRELKTEHSARDIPLVGVALMAMKLQPDGFPRYRERADELSAAANKVLAARRLRPNGESLYSLRHCFKDRLRQARVEDELKDFLMGHKTEQPEYGFGYSLEVKAEVLKGIAFRPPKSV